VLWPAIIRNAERGQSCDIPLAFAINMTLIYDRNLTMHRIHFNKDRCTSSSWAFGN